MTYITSKQASLILGCHAGSVSRRMRAAGVEPATVGLTHAWLQSDVERVAAQPVKRRVNQGYTTGAFPPTKSVLAARERGRVTLPEKDKQRRLLKALHGKVQRKSAASLR